MMCPGARGPQRSRKQKQSVVFYMLLWLFYLTSNTFGNVATG